jgi:hypothetical protein
MQPKRPTCEECEYWTEWVPCNGDRLGCCHRYPPKAIPWSERTGPKGASDRAEWPILNHENFCGEFKLKTKYHIQEVLPITAKNELEQ